MKKSPKRSLKSTKRGYAWLRTARDGSFLLSGYIPSLGGLVRIGLEARRGLYSILILKGKQWQEATVRIGRARKARVRLLSIRSARSVPAGGVEAHALAVSSAKRTLRRKLTIAPDGKRTWKFEDRLPDGSVITGEGTRSTGRDRKAKLVRRRTDPEGKQIWTTESETRWGIEKEISAPGISASAIVSAITSKRTDGTSGQTRKIMWQDATGWHTRALTTWSRKGDAGRTSLGRGNASTSYSRDYRVSASPQGQSASSTTSITNTYQDGSQQIISTSESSAIRVESGSEERSNVFQTTFTEITSGESGGGTANLDSGSSQLGGTTGEGSGSFHVTGPGIEISSSSDEGDDAGSEPSGTYFTGQGSWGYSEDFDQAGVQGESGFESKSDSPGTSTQTGWADSEAGHSDTIVQTNEDGSQTITTTTVDPNGDGTQQITTLDPNGNETGNTTGEVHATPGGTDSGGSQGGDNSGTSGGTNDAGGSGGSGDGQGGDNNGDNGDHPTGPTDGDPGGSGGGGNAGMDWDEGSSEGAPRTLPKHAGRAADGFDRTPHFGDPGGPGGPGDPASSGDEGDGYGGRMGNVLRKVADSGDGEGDGTEGASPGDPLDVSGIKIREMPSADEGGWGGTNDPRAAVAFTGDLIASLTRIKGLTPQNLANMASASLLNRTLGTQIAAVMTLNKQ